MKKVNSKAALTIVALLAVLVFAAPSFATTVYIDFTGGNGHGQMGPGALALKPTFSKIGSSTLKGNYIPISFVGASDSDYNQLASFDVDGAYLGFTLHTDTNSGTLQLYSPAKVEWFGANVSFRLATGPDPRVPGQTYYSFDQFTGPVTMTGVGKQLLTSHGVPTGSVIDVDSQSHIYLKVSKEGKVTYTDSNVNLDPVPEPMTAALILPGLAFLGFVRRRFLA